MQAFKALVPDTSLPGLRVARELDANVRLCNRLPTLNVLICR